MKQPMDDIYEQPVFWFKLIRNLAIRLRSKIYFLFVDNLSPQPNYSVLDLGVSDLDNNYFHKLYPYPQNIIAAGLAKINKPIQEKYPQIKYQQIPSNFSYPFRDNEFDIVHSSAVIEHVGNRSNQLKFIREAYRIGKMGMVSTPNRWYPIEFHVMMPLIHWLPTNLYRKIFQALKLGVYWQEKYLNLLDEKALIKLAEESRLEKYWIVKKKTFGFTSNLLLFWKK